MAAHSDENQALVNELAERHGFSPAAVAHMRDAVARGMGSMAGFNHPEFGGAGQWMRGGMLMIADAFNHELKARINALCHDLARSAATDPRPTAANSQSQTQSVDDFSEWPAWEEPEAWWPAELGTPHMAGQQNDTRYAWFADKARLALQRGRRLTVHDTNGHRLTGVSQQQSDHNASLAFSSPQGPIDPDTLPLVSSPEVQAELCAPSTATGATRPVAPEAGPAQPNAADEIISAIERLGDLHARGLLTDDEFAAKKQQLLDRL